MKLRIQQLEFELESEKSRSRHFEGLSQIALLELKQGLGRVNDKKKRVTDGLIEVEGVKVELLKCVHQLKNVIDSLKNVLH